MGRLLVGLIFTAVLGLAGWTAGSAVGGRAQAELFAFAGAFFAVMVLLATRTKAL